MHVIIQPAETLTSPINEKEELKGKRQALIDKAASTCIIVFQYLSIKLRKNVNDDMYVFILVC